MKPNDSSLIYITTSVIPAEKANSYQAMKMCEAFAKIGTEVELVIPVRFGKVVKKADPFKYYGVKKIFKIRKLFSLDLIPLEKHVGHLGFWIQNTTFAFLTLIYVSFKKCDFVYSRDRFALLFLCLSKKNLIYEVHSLPNKFRFYEKFLYRRLNKIVVITGQMKKIMIKNLNLAEGKIIIAPDAVDIEIFNDIWKTNEELREELNLPQNKKIIGYVGRFFTKGKEKGAGCMLRALKILKETGTGNMAMMFVGDSEDGIRHYQKEAEKIGLKKDDLIFIKQVPFADAPKYEKASDILVMPFPWTKHYAYYASSLKLFEYMASRRPIVATDLPSTREILNENNAIIVDYDNPKALAGGINKALNDKSLAEDISNQAYQDVQKHTWLNRAKKILDFIK